MEKSKCKLSIMAIAIAITIAIIMAIWFKATKPEDQSETKPKQNQDEENLDQSQLNLINLHYSIRNHSVISTSAIALILVCALTMLYCKIKKDKKKRRSEWINMATFAQHPPPPYPRREMLNNIDGAMGPSNFYPNPISTDQERQSMRMTDMSMELEPQRLNIEVDATHTAHSHRNNVTYRSVPNPIPTGTKFPLERQHVTPPQ